MEPAGFGDSRELSVTDLTYGKSLNTVTNATYGTITENMITSVTIKDEADHDIREVRPDVGSRVTVNYTWELPSGHPYGKGSTYTFHLPDKFETATELKGKLAGGTGEVGTYIVTPQGQVTFTFSEEINAGQGMTGTFHVWRQFDKSKLSGGTREDILFDIRDNSNFIIPVHFKPASGKDMDKRGKTDKDRNPREVRWEVDFNKSEREMKDAVFTDTITPEGLEINEGSIGLYKLRVLLNGQVEPLEPVDIAGKVKRTETGFELKLGTIQDAYRVTYTTEIVDGENNKTYSNTAKITGSNNIESEAPANVSVIFSEPLAKESTGYTPSTQTIQWAIQYNYNEREISQSKALLTDTFDTTRQEADLDSFVVNEMTIDDKGRGTKKAELSKDKYRVEKTGEGFTLQFKQDITNAYEIRYSTKAKSRVYDEAVKVTNKVQYADKEADAERTIGQVIFSKSAGSVDYKNKTITWTLTLNSDNEDMDNVVITDSFKDRGLTFIESSLDIPGLTKSQHPEGTDGDYSVSLNMAADEGFMIKFNKSINKEYLITYKTAFDPKLNKPGYKNTAALTWDEGTESQTPITKEAAVTPDSYTKDNGKKVGEYDARTKEVTWTIDVNYNLHEIKNPVLRDFYTGEQSFDPAKVEVRHLLLTGGADGVRTGDALKQGADYVVTPIKQEGTGKDGFELVFKKPIDSAYRIAYITSLEDHPVTKAYTNDAKLYDGDIAAEPLFKGTYTVTPKHGGEYISKTGRQGTGTESDILWNISPISTRGTEKNWIIKSPSRGNLPGTSLQEMKKKLS